MRMLFGILLLFTGACVSPHDTGRTQLKARTNPSAGTTLYVNGLWYEDDGAKITFIKGDRLQSNGVFIDIPEDLNREAVNTIDLKEHYVVPPFGEAHNHSVDNADTLLTAKRYLSQGIFYYKNPNNPLSQISGVREIWDRPETLDVIFSNGGLSVDEGHPETLYKNIAPFIGLNPDELDGDAFFDVETPHKLDTKWPSILAGSPDFLKLYLVNHTRAGDGKSQGLNEQMLQLIVERANESGLRTTVHVETASDLSLALRAGATEAAHLPGYSFHFGLEAKDFEISPTLAAAMAKQRFITVTTTVVAVGANRNNPDVLPLVYSQQAQNLTALKTANAPIAIGSDSFAHTSLDELKSLRSLNVFTDEELLRLWVNTPSLSIFPDRAIGRLRAGYEASFVTMECNPVTDLMCVEMLTKAVKQGSPVDITPVEGGEFGIFSQPLSDQ